MQCHACNLSDICKIFQMVNDMKSIAAIHVSDCRYYQAKKENAPYQFQEASMPPLSGQDHLRRYRTPEELNAISERIKQEHEKQTKKEDIGSFKFTCNECNDENVGIMLCSNCGKSVCDNCLVEDAQDNKVYCQDCWDNTE